MVASRRRDGIHPAYCGTREALPLQHRRPPHRRCFKRSISRMGRPIHESQRKCTGRTTARVTALPFMQHAIQGSRHIRGLGYLFGHRQTPLETRLGKRPKTQGNLGYDESCRHDLDQRRGWVFVL
jgi:hypothetical protein